MTSTPAALAALLVLIGATASAQSTPTRAKPGQTMMVIINVVKADKRQQFEDYIKKFDAAAAKAALKDPIQKRVNEQTRTLKPKAANPDGTFTYIYLMDPVIDGFVYDMDAVLKKALPTAEAAGLEKQFLDSIVTSGHQAYEMVQGEQ